MNIKQDSTQISCELLNQIFADNSIAGSHIANRLFLVVVAAVDAK